MFLKTQLSCLGISSLQCSTKNVHLFCCSDNSSTLGLSIFINWSILSSSFHKGLKNIVRLFLCHFIHQLAMTIDSQKLKTFLYHLVFNTLLYYLPTLLLICIQIIIITITCLPGAYKSRGTSTGSCTAGSPRTMDGTTCRFVFVFCCLP